MVRGYFSNLAAGRFFGPTKSKQGADFIERESQLSRPPYEDQDTKSRRVINAPTAGRARRRDQHLDPFVVADCLDVYTAPPRQFANEQVFVSRRRDRAHEILLDPVAATGCIMPYDDQLPSARR